MLDRLIVLVEEPSMEAALTHILPRLVRNADWEIHSFQCKNDLLAKLPARLRSYAQWLPDTWTILVLVDQDDDDCRDLKSKLESMAMKAGLTSKTAARADEHFQVVTRIAIEELEAWFFGDWNAVRAAYPRVPATIPNKEAFRDPDAIRGGTWEALERILSKAGYFRSGLRKIEFARTVSRQMNPDLNTSRSFHALRDAIRSKQGLP